MYKDFQQFEQYVLDITQKPLIAFLFSIFTLLGCITFLHRFPWPRAHKAWFAFTWTNAITLAYFFWLGNAPSTEWNVHIRLILAVSIAVSGSSLIFLLIRKYIYGSEDKYDRETQDVRNQNILDDPKNLY